MNARTFYLKTTGIKPNRSIHVHHLDKNRDNNSIENLIHLPSRVHLRYHRFRFHLDVILETLYINDWSVSDYVSDVWIRGFCTPYAAKDFWWRELNKYVEFINNALKEKDEKLKINSTLLSYTKDEQSIITFLEQQATKIKK